MTITVGKFTTSRPRPTTPARAVRVAVLGGGRSSEHEVSLASGAAVADGLRAPATRSSPSRSPATASGAATARRYRCCTRRAGCSAPTSRFPSCTARSARTGPVQGLLECLDVPYVGAGVLASALCMDKVVFKELMARAGLPQVGYAAVADARWRASPTRCCASSPNSGCRCSSSRRALGSSVGIVKVKRTEDLPQALANALAHDPRAIVEAMAGGLEVECSVIGNAEPIASEPGEIVAGRRVVRLRGEVHAGRDGAGRARADLRARARAGPRAGGARLHGRWAAAGLARVDFFVDGDEVLVNELNTMPGFTETSVFGKLFAASGVPYEELLDRLVGFALERHAAERAYRH